MTDSSEQIAAHIESLILKSDEPNAIHTLVIALCSLSDLERRWFEHFEMYPFKEKKDEK